MGSSLRNSLHRRNHKERSQPAHRSRFGLLEKHKDYVLRARDFRSKKDRIKRLREKASERNKDEFYFGMVRSKTEGGVHVKERGNTALPTDIVKVLKSQDANYIRAVRQAGLKKIDKLKLQLSALADLTTPGKVGDDERDGGDDEEDATEDDEDLGILKQAGLVNTSKSSSVGRSKDRPKHIVFVSHEDEAKSYRPPQAGPSNSSSKAESVSESIDLGWITSENRDVSKDSSRSSRANGAVGRGQESDVQDRKEEAVTHRRKLLKELAARIKRDQNLRYAGREMEMQKLLMGKGASRKIRGIEKVEDDNDNDEDDEDDEDAFHARRRRRRKVDVGMEKNSYRPRVYKWKAERKK